MTDNPQVAEYGDGRPTLLSFGETREADKTGLCRCRPTNVLYWELSDADSTDCPIHGCPFCVLGADCPVCLGTGQRLPNGRAADER